MNRKPTNLLNIRKMILPLTYEYMFVVLPVLIFVCMEAISKGGMYILKSPEWAIASIFLCFQGASLYMRGLMKAGKPINGRWIAILYMLILVITIAAVLNAFLSIAPYYNTRNKIIFRLVVFLFSSIIFLILSGAGRIEFKK
jgi:hypothetical protein